MIREHILYTQSKLRDSLYDLGFFDSTKYKTVETYEVAIKGIKIWVDPRRAKCNIYTVYSQNKPQCKISIQNGLDNIVDFCLKVFGDIPENIKGEDRILDLRKPRNEQNHNWKELDKYITNISEG